LEDEFDTLNREMIARDLFGGDPFKEKDGTLALPYDSFIHEKSVNAKLLLMNSGEMAVGCKR
jgi:hypothetical protein